MPSFELLDAATYTADLHEANKLGALNWKKEYDFKERFRMDDMSPRSFERLATRLLAQEDEQEAERGEGASLWQAYKGQGDGSLYCKGFDSAGSPFPPAARCRGVQCSSPATAAGSAPCLSSRRAVAPWPATHAQYNGVSAGDCR